MRPERERIAGTKRQIVRPLILLTAILLVGALAGVVGFQLGKRAVPEDSNGASAAVQSLQAQLAAAREQAKTLQGKLDLRRTRHEIDRQALEMVRSEIAAHKERIADLEEGLSFYKGVMAPGEVAAGLSVRTLEIVPREEERRFAYRIVVQQEARKHSLLKGELQVEVFGLLLDREASLPLAELSEDVAEGAIALQFRYFQAIEGELTLPEGFEPFGISLVASASKPQKEEIRKQFNWEPQERFTHVGK